MRSDPPELLLGPVGDWIAALRVTGPPVDASIDDELNGMTVPGTRIVVEFFVIVHEKLVVVRRIR